MKVPARVWAPAARGVVLVDHTHDTRTPLSPDPTRRGWWQGKDVEVGTDYSFSPDGTGPFPDPRSRFQPQGVDGPSRAWAPPPPADPSWVPQPRTGVLGNVIEEIHVGTFTPEGTLDSAASRLDHLADLGVTTVELMPVAQFSGEFGWGYDGVDLFAVHRAYGGPHALVRFINRAHELGMLVCLDTVLNHLGVWGDHLAAFGPYYSGRHTTPWGQGFDLDGPDSEEPRAFLLDVCRYWLVDMHVDALRLDAVHAITDDSPTHLLAELADRVAQWRKETGRHLTLIAESDLNQVSMVTPRPRGTGMDAQWADDVHHALLAALSGQTQGYYADFADADALPHTLSDVFYHDGRWSSFRGSTWGAPVPEDTDRRRFVVFSQDHDQVGNRARGDRPSASLTPAQLAAASAVVLLGTFTPMLFQGEEWGTRRPFCFFADQEDEERAKLVREGREREFGAHGWSGEVPDPTSPATLDASRLDWSELDTPRSRTLLSWYRSLIVLREELPGLREGGRAWAAREGVLLRRVVGGCALELTLDGSDLDALGDAPPAWPDGQRGDLLAEFPASDAAGAAVRVWRWTDRLGPLTDHGPSRGPSGPHRTPCTPQDAG